MEVFKIEPISPVKAIPGLYISDISTARSAGSLREHGITHVASIIKQQQSPVFADSKIEHLCVSIEDSPLENLLKDLDMICSWIDHALASETDAAGEPRQPRVLVHCLQGISRSGAVVVAYIMRSQSIEYEPALAIAQSSRSIINPNSGFADQLRLWHRLGYTIYPQGSENISSGPETTSKALKQEYRAWKAEKDAISSKDDQVKNRVMAQSMASMAASFGRRRLQMKTQTSSASPDVDTT